MSSPSILVSGRALCRAFRVVEPARAKDNHRYGLNGVHAGIVRDHTRLQLTTTDGHRLARVEVPIEWPSPAELSPTDRVAWVELFAITMRKRLLVAQADFMARPPRDVDLAKFIDTYKVEPAAPAGMLPLVWQAIDGEFPDADAVIPRKDGVIVKREALRVAVKAAVEGIRDAVRPQVTELTSSLERARREVNRLTRERQAVEDEARADIAAGTAKRGSIKKRTERFVSPLAAANAKVTQLYEQRRKLQNRGSWVVLDIGARAVTVSDHEGRFSTVLSATDSRGRERSATTRFGIEVRYLFDALSYLEGVGGRVAEVEITAGHSLAPVRLDPIGPGALTSGIFHVIMPRRIE